MTITIYNGNALEILQGLPDGLINCCVTSPPYWGMRDYNNAAQIGNEKTPEEYVERMVEIFREVWRVMRKDGTLWLNLGDCYAGSGRAGKQALDKLGEKNGRGGGKKHSSQLSGRAPTPTGLKAKDLVGIPWRVAFALQSDGWYLRRDIIWNKSNPMPEPVKDRPTSAHEYIFLLTKSDTYFYDSEAIMEPAVTCEDRPAGVVRDRELGYDSKTAKMRKRRKSVERGGFNGKTNAMKGREAFRAVVEFRNKRSVWTLASQPYPGAHFAPYPPDLIEPCILAGCPGGGMVLDPFFGSGTTGMVADRHGRNCIGIELNPEYIDLARQRLVADGGMLMDINLK